MSPEEEPLSSSDYVKIGGLVVVAATALYGLYYVIMSPIERSYDNYDVPGIVTERPAWLDETAERLDALVEGLYDR